MEGIGRLSCQVPQGKHIVTGDIRRLAGKLYQQIGDKSIGNVSFLAKELLEQYSHAFGELLRQHKELFVKMSGWTKDEDFWVRRAAAVVLIACIMKNDYKGLAPYAIADALMQDPHDLVQKGYGWMLKCLSQMEPDAVREYLAANSMRMPRTAFRYAVEKFDRDTKEKLMAL